MKNVIIAIVVAALAATTSSSQDIDDFMIIPDVAPCYGDNDAYGSYGGFVEDFGNSLFMPGRNNLAPRITGSGFYGVLNAYSASNNFTLLYDDNSYIYLGSYAPYLEKQAIVKQCLDAFYERFSQYYDEERAKKLDTLPLTQIFSAKRFGNKAYFCTLNGVWDMDIVQASTGEDSLVMKRYYLDDMSYTTGMRDLKGYVREVYMDDSGNYQYAVCDASYDALGQYKPVLKLKMPEAIVVDTFNLYSSFIDRNTLIIQGDYGYCVSHRNFLKLRLSDMTVVDSMDIGKYSLDIEAITADTNYAYVKNTILFCDMLSFKNDSVIVLNYKPGRDQPPPYVAYYYGYFGKADTFPMINEQPLLIYENGEMTQLGLTDAFNQCEHPQALEQEYSGTCMSSGKMASNRGGGLRSIFKWSDNEFGIWLGIRDEYGGSGDSASTLTKQDHLTIYSTVCIYNLDTKKWRKFSIPEAIIAPNEYGQPAARITFGDITPCMGNWYIPAQVLVEDNDVRGYFRALIKYDTGDVDGISERDPSAFRNISVYPNPVLNDGLVTAQVQCDIANISGLDIGLYDMFGRRVLDLSNSYEYIDNSNTLSISFMCGEEFYNGIYYINMKSGGECQTTSLIISSE
jgi:hypothetical protein